MNAVDPITTQILQQDLTPAPTMDRAHNKRELFRLCYGGRPSTFGVAEAEESAKYAARKTLGDTPCPHS